MDQLTVKDLYEACKLHINKGNGDKLIVISDDNEGNGYHGMFYALTEITDENRDCFIGLISDSQDTNTNNLIILG